MLKKVGQDSALLDISSLELNRQYLMRAYLYGFKEGYSTVEKGYFRLYLKDINGRIITGMLFNVDKFKEQGLTMQALKGKPVVINFETQQYNGSLSLVVNTIEHYEGMFDFGSFIGVAEGVNDFFLFIEDVLSKLVGRTIKLPSEYLTKSLRYVYDGRAGGYTKLLEMIVNNLVSLDAIIGVDRVELAEIIVHLQSIYYKYLVMLEDIDFTTKNMQMKVLYDAQLALGNTEVAPYVMDALTALLEIGEPETFQGYLVTKMYKDNMETLKLACVYDRMLIGVRKEVGGKVFLKY
ncbi:hypothetical protein [Paraclostridium bifermentans]|uniref:hypothetical protein n=1 Tax=Paraclostridium bifermentans TaxID=1490 RepID=UPI00374F9F6B